MTASIDLTREGYQVAVENRNDMHIIRCILRSCIKSRHVYSKRRLTEYSSKRLKTKPAVVILVYTCSSANLATDMTQERTCLSSRNVAMAMEESCAAAAGPDNITNRITEWLTTIDIQEQKQNV